MNELLEFLRDATAITLVLASLCIVLFPVVAAIDGMIERRRIRKNETRT